MRVAADHDIDCAVEAAHDVDDRPSELGAVVGAAAIDAALMYQHDDGFGARAFEFGDQAIHRVRFVEKFQSGHDCGREDGGRFFQSDADEGDLDAAEFAYGIRRKQCGAGVAHFHVGRQKSELRAAKGQARFASAARAAAGLQAQQLGAAAIEFVIAHAVQIELEAVHRFDRRLVVEIAGGQG